MFIRKKALYDGKVSLQICENSRDEQGKVKQRVLRHVGTTNASDEEAVKKLTEAATFLKRQLEEEAEQKALEIAPDLPIIIPSKIFSSPPENLPPQSKEQSEPLWLDASQLKEESRIVEGIHAVFSPILDHFGLQPILGKRHYETLRDVIMARIAWPSSKLRASENLAKHFNIDIDSDKIYRLMDLLEGQEGSIQKCIFNAFRPLIGDKIEVLFFDVTTLYFESIEEDELRRFGFSKDQKTHLTQVVLALATTRDGLPLGYKLFPGNTAETSTLLQAVQEWRTVFCIEQVTIVADRAMMNEPNLKILEESGIRYVIAAKLKMLDKTLQKMILSRQNETIVFQDKEDAIAVQEHLLMGRRLIVNHSTKRARKDAKDREQILKKLKARIGDKGSTKKLVTNRVYLSLISEEGNSKVKIDEEKVSLAAQWDGLHGIITNIPEVNSQDLLSLYRRLWVIEESFRINKNTLEMRPVYHHLSRRIRAHILICYIVFGVTRYAQKRIAMQYENMSIDRIRSTLIDVQYSILKHKETTCLYRLPSKISKDARQIYSVFQVKRNGYLSKMV